MDEARSVQLAKDVNECFNLFRRMCEEQGLTGLELYTVIVSILAVYEKRLLQEVPSLTQGALDKLRAEMIGACELPPPNHWN